MLSKTKQEKLISQYRKKLKLMQSLKNTDKDDGEFPRARTVEKRTQPELSNQQSDTTNENDIRIKKFFISDFRRTLLIIAFILALEFSLYFASMYNNLRLGK